jgi:broad specificity phosphatase PhoE
MTTCVIYLICRGYTANDEAPVQVLLGKRMEARLSRRGKHGLADLAATLQTRDLHTIYTSPSVRAVETAKIVLDVAPRATLRIRSALGPVDYGRWEGLSWPQIVAQDGNAFSAQLRDPQNATFGGGETLTAIQQRAMAFMRRHAVLHNRQSIGVVTHCVVAKTIIAGIAGLPLQYVRDLDQTPGCVSIIRAVNDVFSIGAVNQTLVLEKPEFIRGEA